MEGEKMYQRNEQSPLNMAIAYIHAKQAETMATGRIDSEPSAFKAILDGLTQEKLSPSEAMGQVDDLIASRQDYN